MSEKTVLEKAVLEHTVLEKTASDDLQKYRRKKVWLETQCKEKQEIHLF